MSFARQCSVCGTTVTTDQPSGSVTKCPNCGDLMRVGETPRPRPPQSAPALRQSLDRFLLGKMPLIVGVVCVVGFLYSFQTPPSPWVAVHYLCLITLIVLLSRAMIERLRPTGRTLAKVLSAIVAVLLVATYCNYGDIYEKRVENADHIYVNSYARTSSRPYYRWIIERNGGFLTHGSVKGREGKPHGEWTTLFNGQLSRSWYWYGEEISEGEWELRNKR